MAKADQEIIGSIKLLKEYVVTCAVCMNQIRTQNFTRKQFAKYLRHELGWSRWANIGWICEGCKKKRKGESDE